MGERIGVLIETRDGGIKKANFGVITAARGYGHELLALVLDGRGAEHRVQLEEYGVHKVVDISVAGGPIGGNPELLAGAIVQAVNHFAITSLLGLTSSQGRDLLPRIAAALGAPLVLDCIGVNLAERTAVKSQFSGKTVARMKLEGTPRIYGIRPNSVEAEPAPSSAEVTPYQAAVETGRGMVMKAVSPGRSRGIDLTEAEIIVSGGRAMGGAENFALLHECAEVMGAAVGASRAAVDSGYAPHDLQVGQTGKTVSPRLYIASGISGSIQHYAGMKTSGVIVAVNIDPEAPIFAKCDYGVVGDLFEVVPELTRQLRDAAGTPGTR